MKKRILRALCLMIAAMLMLTGLTATAEGNNDGQMSITVGKDTSVFDRSNIVLAAYLLAKGDYGDWTPVSSFETIKITSRDDGSAWIDQSLKQIQNRISIMNLPATQEAATDEQGKALFTDLEHGIYYVQMVSAPDEGLTINPMLLSTPNREKEVKISANAKYEYQTQTKKLEDSYWPPVEQLTVSTGRGERLESIDEYETALGLGNIQIHVGVCFE